MKKIFFTLLATCLAMPMTAEITEDNKSVTTDETNLLEDKSVSTDEAFLHNDAWSASDQLATLTEKWKRSDIASIPKFGGYIVSSYKYDGGLTETNGEGFNIRYVRLYIDGTVMKDFKYRVQLQMNGTAHLKDATIEWVHWKFLQLKAGQFKRAFTYENPYNPWDVGFGDYSQIVKKLAGMGDRCGEGSVAGGRDIGVQVQGDLLKSKKDGHYWLHYQAAVYNGQGINTKDANKKKDFIGTIQFSPIKYLSIGAFGWFGDWASGTTYKNAAGETEDLILNRNRWALGVKYENPDNGWSARAEYVHSNGHKASDWDAENRKWKHDDQNGGDKADGWYATVGVPVWRWLKIYAKYDVYRDYATWGSAHSMYCLSANMQPHKNLMLQLEYNYNDDKTSSKRHYSQFWAEAYIRF